MYAWESTPTTLCAEEDGLASVRGHVGVRESYAFVYVYEPGQTVPTSAPSMLTSEHDEHVRTSLNLPFGCYARVEHRSKKRLLRF